MIFLQNLPRIGDFACGSTSIIVVDIPEGVKTIGAHAFEDCRSLTTVSFPRTLKSISEYAFDHCSSLDNVDLLHTNLQELGERAFCDCSELTSMTIPDSLQTLGRWVFAGSSKLVPSNICIYNNNAVVSHLRFKQQNQY